MDKFLTCFELETVLREVNGVSRYKHLYDPYMRTVQIPETLTNSNVPLEEWLRHTRQDTINAGDTICREVGSGMAAVTQPGPAMAMAHMGIPFVWFVKNNVGFSPAALVPPSMRDEFATAMLSARMLVFEGRHYYRRAVANKLPVTFADPAAAAVLSGHSVHIPVPIHNDLLKYEATPSFEDTDRLALVVAPPVPWKTGQGQLLEVLSYTHPQLDWVWVTGSMSWIGLMRLMSRARIGVHFSVGESRSMLMQEHLWFHPTYALDGEDGYPSNWSSANVFSCWRPGDLLDSLRISQVMDDKNAWLSAVSRQRDELRVYTVDRFNRQMDELVARLNQW